MRKRAAAAAVREQGLRPCTAYLLTRGPFDTTLAEQRAAIDAWASAAGLLVAEEIADEPVVIRGRSELTREITGVLDREEPPRFLVAAERSRFERPDLEIDLRAELGAVGVTLLAVGDRAPKPDPAPVVVRGSYHGLGIAERLLRGREDAARSGYHQGGPAPYGYAWVRACYGAKAQLAIREDEAAVVRAIFSEYLLVRSIKLTIERLEGLGLVSRNGRPWSRAGVAFILKNETYLGRVRFGDIRAYGQHQAIVEPGVFEEARRRMFKNNKRSGRKVRGRRPVVV